MLDHDKTRKFRWGPREGLPCVMGSTPGHMAAAAQVNAVSVDIFAVHKRGPHEPRLSAPSPAPVH
eukprot:6411686-Pyramimonas_sp.AAC.1